MRSRLASLAASYERLSGREQVLVIVLIAAFAVILTWGSGFLINRDLQSREKRIAAKVEQLKRLAAMRGDYQRRLADQRRLASEIKTNNNVRLLSYLEDISRQSNIELGNAAERAGEPTGSEGLKEVAAEVMVKNVSIDRLYDFLKRIEEGNRLVKVRRLNVKSRYDNPKMLDATVTVGTLKTAEG